MFLKRGPVFNSLFLKILFFLTFSLDKNNIGCPPSSGEAKERDAELVTADHHEFDFLEGKAEAKFYWIR